jgi:hypothetical protein
VTAKADVQARPAKSAAANDKCNLMDEFLCRISDR